MNALPRFDPDPRPARPDPAGALTVIELVEFTRFIADEVRAGRYPFVEFDDQVRWHRRIYRDQRVDVWLISWLPEQGTQLHDHGGSAGSFTVISGQLDEAVYIRTGRDAGQLRERSHPAGRSIGFDHRYVHDVRNLSTSPAVSVHAYSAPLTSMTFYDVDRGELAKLATLITDDPEPAIRPGTVMTARFASVEELLADARSRLSRLSPRQAAAEIDAGARLVDIRPSWQRRAEGEIPGALIVERNHLEWRLHPRSDSRLPVAVEGRRWIVVCSEGYTSSLAADALASLGISATDIVGGFAAWRAAGLPTRLGETPLEQVVVS